MHILKQGRGIPFVFLHGFLGNSADWGAVCVHLPDCLCIGIDLPGHGSAPFSENFVEAFPDFGGKICLVGYSMGGRLAMQVAARFPRRVAALVLCSTHPGIRGVEERKQRVKGDETWAKKLREWPEEEFLSEWYRQPIFAGFQPKRQLGDREALAQVLMHYSAGRLPVVEVGGLAVVGERDEKFRGLWKECRVIASAGHAVHLEQPRAVAEVLRSGTCFRSRSTRGSEIFR